MHSSVAAVGTADPSSSTASPAPVAVLPAGAHIRRRRLRDAGLPCFLVVAEGDPPPFDCGPLEDWAREPIAPAELALRLRTLEARHAAAGASAVLATARAGRSSPLHAVHT
jgi:hypothetical protein